MRTMKFVAVLLALVLFAGCKSIPVDPNQQAFAQERSQQVTACANSTDVAACMLGVAAINGAAAGSYQRPPTVGEQWAAVLPGIGNIAVGLANSAVNWHQSDNSRRSTEAQYNFLSRAIESSNATAAAVATAGPTISVGGNYGNTDNSTHNTPTTTTTTTVGAGGVLGNNNEVVNGSNNFIRSPIDLSNPGNDCDNGSCNPTTPPEETGNN